MTLDRGFAHPMHSQAVESAWESSRDQNKTALHELKKK